MSPLFKSNLEKWCWGELKKRKGLEISYESEALPYYLVKKYIPDFIIRFKDGHKIYIETKGYLRPSDRTKLLSVLSSNDIDLRLVFSVDNKLNKRSKTRYSDWCNKHNIKYAVGKIPKEWLKPT